MLQKGAVCERSCLSYRSNLTVKCEHFLRSIASRKEEIIAFWLAWASWSYGPTTTDWDLQDVTRFGSASEIYEISVVSDDWVRRQHQTSGGCIQYWLIQTDQPGQSNRLLQETENGRWDTARLVTRIWTLQYAPIVDRFQILEDKRTSRTSGSVTTKCSVGTVS